MIGGFSLLSRRVLTVAVLVLWVGGCATSNTAGGNNVKQQEFKLRSLAKDDMNEAMEIHVKQARAHLRELMLKLYKRNPRELKKSTYPSAEANVNRVFSRTTNWTFRELDGIHGTDAIILALREEYRGDRVFAFMMGMTSMIMASYNYKTEFFLYDSIDPQGFYNSARNIEIAVWRLENSYDTHGTLFMLSNSLPDEDRNLSYERLFGKLISLQDTMAEILAGRANRTISKIIQRVATAVFLPIP